MNAAADRGAGARSFSTMPAVGNLSARAGCGVAAAPTARCAARVNLTAIMSVEASMNNKVAVACLMTVVLWGGPGVSNAWAGGHGGTHGHGGSLGTVGSISTVGP